MSGHATWSKDALKKSIFLYLGNNVLAEMNNDVTDKVRIAYFIGCLSLR